MNALVKISKFRSEMRYILFLLPDFYIGYRFWWRIFLAYVVVVETQFVSQRRRSIFREFSFSVSLSGNQSKTTSLEVTPRSISTRHAS